MCNALSPEKAVMWSVLYQDRPICVRATHFTHPPFRVWFGAVQDLRRRGDPVTATTIENRLQADQKTLAAKFYSLVKHGTFHGQTINIT